MGRALRSKEDTLRMALPPLIMGSSDPYSLGASNSKCVYLLYALTGKGISIVQCLMDKWKNREKE